MESGMHFSASHLPKDRVSDLNCPDEWVRKIYRWLNVNKIRPGEITKSPALREAAKQAQQIIAASKEEANSN